MSLLASLLIAIQWAFPLGDALIRNPGPVPLQVLATSPAGIAKVGILDPTHPRRTLCIAEPIGGDRYQCDVVLPAHVERIRLRAVALDNDGDAATATISFRGGR